LGKSYTVFTYGSLMKDFSGYDMYLKDADFVCDARVRGDLRFFCSDYPVMINRSSGERFVKGEIYKVDEETMEKLRKYEGVGNLFTCYTERVIEAETAEGILSARAFVAIPEIEIPVRLTSKSIPEGDWREFKSGSRYLSVFQPLMLALSVMVLGAVIWQLGVI